MVISVGNNFYRVSLTPNYECFDRSGILKRCFQESKKTNLAVKVVYSVQKEPGISQSIGIVDSIQKDHCGDYVIIKTKPRILHQIYFDQIDTLNIKTSD